MYILDISSTDMLHMIFSKVKKIKVWPNIYEKYQHLQYQTYITRTTMKYIFMIYTLDISSADMFHFIHDQNLQSLTLTKNYMQHIFGTGGL
jgi:hypothetical protein